MLFSEKGPGEEKYKIHKAMSEREASANFGTSVQSNQNLVKYEEKALAQSFCKRHLRNPVLPFKICEFNQAQLRDLHCHRNQSIWYKL